MSPGELVARFAHPLGPVLAIDADGLLAHIPPTVVEEVTPRAALLARPSEPWSTAIVGGLGDASPLEMARALSSQVRTGGSVIFALPTARSGLRRASGMLLGVLRRKRPVLLEELCEALLIAGLHTIEAWEFDDAAGTSIVKGQTR